jgi:hypothetical protein
MRVSAGKATIAARTDENKTRTFRGGRSSFATAVYLRKQHYRSRIIGAFANRAPSGLAFPASLAHRLMPGTNR